MTSSTVFTRWFHSSAVEEGKQKNTLPVVSTIKRSIFHSYFENLCRWSPGPGLAVMWCEGAVRVAPPLCRAGLLKVLEDLQGGEAPRCTLGIVVQVQGGRTPRRLAERRGEQRELQLVDGAGGGGGRGRGQGSVRGRVGGQGHASSGVGGRRVHLRVVGGDGAPQFGSSVLEPHLRKRECVC